METEPTRADRLGVLLAQLAGVPAIPPEEAVARTALTAYGQCAEAVTDEDMSLAVELLNIEQGLRRDCWDALERLGSLVAGTRGPLDERIAALPYSVFIEAARCRARLGRPLGGPARVSGRNAEPRYYISVPLIDLKRRLARGAIEQFPLVLVTRDVLRWDNAPRVISMWFSGESVPREPFTVLGGRQSPRRRSVERRRSSGGRPLRGA